MKRILVIGASDLQVPALIKANEMGLYVGVVDYNPNAVGVKFADEYFNCSTVDTEGVLKIARLFKPDGIMTMATDMPMRTIARVCDHLNLSAISVNTSIFTTDKLKMIEKFKEYNVPSPWYYSIDNADDIDKIKEEIKFPCIMKPIDSSGSRGVVLCKDFIEFQSGYEYAARYSRNGGVIIEEYMQGNEVSVEVFVDNGNANILQVTDKLTTGEPHFVEIGHSQPTRLTNRQEIEAVAKSGVMSLGIQNGPAHVEIMVTSSGSKIIEIGARMGGDCITSHLVPLSTGVDMTKNTILKCLNMPVNLETKEHSASAIRYITASKLGKISSLSGVEQAKKINGVATIVLTKQVGSEVGEVLSSSDRIGYVIAKANTVEDAISICERAKSIINIEVE